MKRKGVLIILMLLVATALIFVSKGLQKNEALKQEALVESIIQSSQQEENKAEIKTETVKEDSKPSPENSTTSNTDSPKDVKSDSNVKNNNEKPKAEDAAKTTKAQPKATPVQAPNIIITDTVSGRVILSKAVTYNGESVAQATIKTLEAAKISYKTSIFGDTVYFSSINGIKERSAGASSGWCYYVNGKKLSIGAGSYKLKQEDKLEWKFLKDGVSN
jgi:type II secretory pathway pseudopilin PulG